MASPVSACTIIGIMKISVYMILSLKICYGVKKAYFVVVKLSRFWSEMLGETRSAGPVGS